MADGQVLQIKVRSQDGNELTFKVRSNTPFQKVFNAYCEKAGLEQQLLRFLLDGQRLLAEETPSHHDMQDGDTIDVLITQLGGGRAGL